MTWFGVLAEVAGIAHLFLKHRNLLEFTMVAPVIYLFYNGANALKIFDSHSLVIQEVTPRGPMLYSVQFVSLMFCFMYMITFSTYYVKIMWVRPRIGEDEPWIFTSTTCYVIQSVYGLFDLQASVLVHKSLPFFSKCAIHISESLGHSAKRAASGKIDTW